MELTQELDLELGNIEKRVKSERLPDNLALLRDPYGYFYEEELKEEDPDINLDENNVQFNPENYEKYLIEELKVSRKTKRSFVRDAMFNDPAFMVNPENYYNKAWITPSLRKGLDDEQYKEVLAIFDPVTWGQRYLLKKHGGWKPRNSKDGIPYQSQMIRCKSKRIVIRAGRRIGKTAAMVVRILHKAFTFVPKLHDKPNFNIVVFTPNQAQIKVIFKMLEIFIDGNEQLLSMIKENGKIPTRQQPQYTLELNNGVTIQGFVSGSSAVRGSAADMLVLDEASFLTSNDTDAVLALINEHKNVELLITSTPKGLKDYFYERVHDPSFISFYFPSDKFHPFWSKKMEEEFHSQLTESGYRHEVLADFSADGEGVYQTKFVDAAFLNDFTYAECRPTQGWVYGMGVDWNDPENGTQIKVAGFNMQTGKYRLVDTAAIHTEGWTQTIAVQKVRELNRKWKPSFIYVDQGHGGTQIENLHELGVKAPANSLDRRLIKVKGIFFKSVIEVIDPWMKKRVKKEAKPFMVNNTVRLLEQYLVEIPSEDEILKKQLEGYTIDHITPSGSPVYAKDPKYGDHAHDALILSLLGFTMEHSQLGKPRMATNIGSTPQNIWGIRTANQNTKSEQFLDTIDPDRKQRDASLLRDKAMDRKELEQSQQTVSLSNLVSVVSFKRKKPSQHTNHPFLNRTHREHSRVKF